MEDVNIQSGGCVTEQRSAGPPAQAAPVPSVPQHLAVRGASVRWLLPALILVFALTCGCRTPIHADRTSISSVYRELGRNALDGGRYSDVTRIVLHRHDCEKAFRAGPVQVLRQLHDQLLADPQPDLLLALIELNYFHGDRLWRSPKPGARRDAGNFFLAATVYAYFYLANEVAGPRADIFSPGPAFARDFYNRSLGRALLPAYATNAVARLEEGVRCPPIGPVEVSLNTNNFPWPFELVSELVLADAYSVKGLSVRNRQRGLGAPLIATGQAQGGMRPRLAATAFLRVSGRIEDWSAGTLRASLEIYSGGPRGCVQIAGRDVPLEVDVTAPLAYALNNTAVWKLGQRQFFSSREIVKSGIYRYQPYQPGLIPVVFVHGTFSSPVRWAEMCNTLAADPLLRARFQFWFFIYNSGNPVAYSAANLREALIDTVHQLDPEGRDPALRQIVLIGHSQGGLLSKLAVVRTGDKLWRMVSDQSLEQLKISEELRAQLRRMAFIEPVPAVRRVIFIATPHRGSYRANGFTRRLATRLVSLPRELVSVAGQVTQIGEQGQMSAMLRRRVPTSLDGMSPRNPGLLALAELPPAPGVTSHSIIAVSGRRPLARDRDGLVAYPSAHVSYAASERVVRSRHSCQGQPATIEEVRRILLEHARAL